jgi:hypothetical protein
VLPHTTAPVLTASLQLGTEERGWFLIVTGIFFIAFGVQRIWFAHRPGGGYSGSIAAPRRWKSVITRAQPVRFRIITVMWGLVALLGAWFVARGSIDVFLWITR